MADDGPLPRGRRPGRARGRLLAVLLMVTVMAGLLGVPAGLVWAAITPRVAVVVTGPGSAHVINPETRAFFAADGWFCVVAAAGGLLTGVTGYLIAVRRHGAAAAAGLILGGLAASLLTWWIGSVRRGSFRTALALSHRGTVLHAPLELRAHAALVIWPLAAAVLVALAELAGLLGAQGRGGRAAASPGTAARRQTTTG